MARMTLEKQRAISRKRWFLATAMAASLLVAGCNTAEVTSSNFEDDITAPDVLYNEALANLDAGNLNEAKKRVEELDRQHPYSEYSRKSLILATFINYRRGEYAEAVASGERFIRLYPGDKDAAYAQYLIGHVSLSSDAARHP